MKIEKSEYSYQVTECDLKFGEQITLDGKLLIPISTLDKILAEIKAKSDDIDFGDKREYEEGIQFGLMLAYQIVNKAESKEDVR